mgnify:CR=1 FL=1
MKARKTLASAVAAASVLASMAMLSACGKDAGQALDAAGQAALCAQLPTAPLSLPQKFTAAALSPQPTARPNTNACHRT